MNHTSQETRTLLQTLLDGVEQVGNKVPHPAVIFLVLMGVVVLLSQVFSALGTSVSYQRINPQTHELEDLTATVNSLLTADGILWGRGECSHGCFAMGMEIRHRSPLAAGSYPGGLS